MSVEESREVPAWSGEAGARFEVCGAPARATSLQGVSSEKLDSCCPKAEVLVLCIMCFAHLHIMCFAHLHARTMSWAGMAKRLHACMARHKTEHQRAGSTCRCQAPT